MLKEYSSYFVAYLLTNITEKTKENIKQIILFGSVARNEAEKESDIDMFIDTTKKTKKIETDIKKVEEKFYNSREASLFKLNKIDNKINLIIGKLDKWKDLKKSIESTGIILYGSYISSKIKGKKYAIIFWDKIEKNRGAFLNKIYGFKIKDKTYSGLIENFGGKKLGKSCIMIPVQYREDILDLVKKYKANAKIIEVYY